VGESRRNSAEVKRLNRRLDEVASGIRSAKPATLYKEQNEAGSAAATGCSRAVPQLLRAEPDDRAVAAAADARAVRRLDARARGPRLRLPVLLNRPLFLGVAFAAMLGALPLLYVPRARNRHMQDFERQLPRRSTSWAARARGHAFPTAIKMVAEEMKDPIGGEFRILFDEMNYGVPQQTALLNLASRTDSTDLSYFVIAVLIQRDSGATSPSSSTTSQQDRARA